MKFNGNEFTWFFYGGLTVVGILIAIFLYPEYKLYKKKLRRKRAQQSRGKNPQTKGIVLWPIIILLLMLVGVPIGIFFLYRLVFQKVYSDLSKVQELGTIPSWVWQTVLVLLVLGLLWYFRKEISSKIPSKPKWKWKPPAFKAKWIWNILAILIIAGVVYWRWTVGERQKKEKEYWAPNAYIPPSIFKLDSTNLMKKGEPKRFTQDPGDLLHFYPKDTDTIVYTITKLENRTRTWSVKAWRNSKCEPEEERLDNLEPTDEAKLGPSEIVVDRDASVVALLKGNK